MCRKSEIPDSGLQGNNFLDPPYNIAKSCVQPINAIPNLAPIFLQNPSSQAPNGPNPGS